MRKAGWMQCRCGCWLLQSAECSSCKAERISWRGPCVIQLKEKAEAFVPSDLPPGAFISKQVPPDGLQAVPRRAKRRQSKGL